MLIRVGETRELLETMPDQSILSSLLEVFPQIGYGTLRNIAVAYADDIDAAAEFVLREVLPNTNAFDVPSNGWDNEDTAQFSSAEGRQQVEDSDFHSGLESVIHERFNNSAVSSHLNPTDKSTARHEENIIGEQLIHSLAGLHSSAHDVALASEQSVFPVESILGSLQANTPFQPDSRVTSFVVDHSPISGSENMNNEHRGVQSSSDHFVDAYSVEQTRSSSSENKLVGSASEDDLNLAQENDLPARTIRLSHLIGIESLDDAIAREKNDKIMVHSPTSVSENMDNEHTGIQSFDHFVGAYSVEQLHSSSSENKLAGSASEDDLKLAHENDLPARTTLLSHSIGIESLNDAIAREKNNKDTLLSSVVSVSNMLEQVELHEARVKQAKSEASNAAHDILVKAGELKEIFKHAREENDKYAGEVFGEKSILATEAQELQSRLHTISEERNKSLSTIEEMHRTLQARLAAAEERMAVAEKEKLEREGVAQKALNEYELLLDAAKKESVKLELQAQENSKLREFLMDRGRVVDALQGEMLGIFTNIMLLKDRVEGCLPADKPLKLFSSSLSASMKSSVSGSSHSSSESLQIQKPACMDTTDKKITKVPGSLSSNSDGWESWDIIEDEAFTKLLV